MDILIFSCLVATILILWFNTEAVVEYSSFLCPKLLKIKEYKEWKKSNIEDDYVGFLVTHYYSSFWVRLICCPFCLGLWLSVLFGALSSNFLFFAPIYIFSLTLFFVLVKLRA